MGRLPFRDYHLIRLMEGYDPKRGALDAYIAKYLRENRAVGSKDRKEIVNTVYQLVRWQLLLDACLPEPHTWQKRLELFRSQSIDALREQSTLSPYQKASCPRPLYRLLVDLYGPSRAHQLCLSMNQEAPVTVRVNPLKGNRQQLEHRLSAHFPVTPTEMSPLGLQLQGRQPLFQLPLFHEGWFEVQDEGSQMLALMVDPKPGDLVMDFCAGSGGKSLGFAHKMQGRGQLYLHDIRQEALREARKRLKRAGIQNAQFLHAQDPALKKLKKKMDWVLVDAPCTGTGTLRRNPDMKNKFSLKSFHSLIGEQRTIFEKALSHCKKGGKIVYSTCSVLHQENQEQMQHFLDHYPIRLIGEPFVSTPDTSSMDGFFGAVFEVV